MVTTTTNATNKDVSTGNDSSNDSKSTSSDNISTEPEQSSEHRPTREDRLANQRKHCQSLIVYLTTNKCPANLTKKEARNDRNQAKTHQWDSKRKELVYIGPKKDVRNKIVTELEEVMEILTQYHSNPMGGHSGVNSTLAKISQYYMWNSMKEDVVEYCKTCDPCQRYDKLKTQASELKSITVDKALELVGMDLIGPLPTTEAGFKYVLTFTDYHTKFVDFYPLREKAAIGVSHCIKTFVCRWGAPSRLLSDQGREFVAKVNTEVCKGFGITRSVTSAYHPQTNGLDERTNKTLKVRLAKLVNEHQNNWDTYLEEVAFSIRTQKQGSTKYSPFFLMFGRHPRTPMEMEEASEETDNLTEDIKIEDLEEMLSSRADMMADVNKKVKENVEKAQAKQKKDFAKRKEKGVKVFSHSVGDLVLRKVMKNIGRKGGKMDALWTGPYRIVEIDCHQRISLAYVESGEGLKVKVPYDQIRPHQSSNLHKPQPTSIATTATSTFTANSTSTVTSTASSTATSTAASNSASTCTSTDQSTHPTEEPTKVKQDVIVIVSETKAQKRKVGLLPVSKPANLTQDISGFLPAIQDGGWLTDDRIDHAQAMLAKEFSNIGGMQAVWVFISQGCQSIGTPHQKFIQIINISGNHWITVSNIGCPKDNFNL